MQSSATSCASCSNVILSQAKGLSDVNNLANFDEVTTQLIWGYFSFGSI